MIAAHAAGLTIGTGDRIPWDLPRDREHFRRHAAGKALLIGRRTFEEMLGWFEDAHLPIVLTRDPKYRHARAAAAVPDLPAAIAVGLLRGCQQLLVCGGAATYHAALPFADELILTEIAAAVEGPAKFPEIVPSQWSITASQHFPADDQNAHPMTIKTLARIRRTTSR